MTFGRYYGEHRVLQLKSIIQTPECPGIVQGCSPFWGIGDQIWVSPGSRSAGFYVMLSIVTDACMSQVRGCRGLRQLCQLEGTLKWYEATGPQRTGVPWHKLVYRVSSCMQCSVYRQKHTPITRVIVPGVRPYAIPGVAVNAYPCSVWGCQGIDVMPHADRCKP